MCASLNLIAHIPQIVKHAISDTNEGLSTSGEDMFARINQLAKENSALEKVRYSRDTICPTSDSMLSSQRLNAALLNHEVAEASTKVILQELEDAKATVARLTLNQAKSVGWDVRLNNAMQERDDLKQEVEVERQRSKSADGHIAVLKERCCTYASTSWMLMLILHFVQPKCRMRSINFMQT